jgi:hypothetical protein
MLHKLLSPEMMICVKKESSEIKVSFSQYSINSVVAREPISPYFFAQAPTK